MVTGSSTHVVRIAPTTSSPRLCRCHNHHAATATRGSQTARSWTYTGLVGSAVPANAVGTQTEVLVIRGLSVGVSIRDIIRRELSTGLLAGTLLGLAMLVTLLVLWGDAAVAVTVALTVVAAAAAAELIAIALPWLLDRAGTDPAVGSGPTATIVRDLLSLVIYFAIATAIIT